ncbi:MAG: response regulator [Planctomycetales bacterium]|nr:response regulator [Planctomycetales bacterium]
MLVLSRKPEQTIRFPNLGITIDILQVNGKTVKIGVDAPRDIAVLRGEIVQAEKKLTASKSESSEKSREPMREQRHELRNRLHAAKFALYMLQRQLEAGNIDKAESTLKRALTALGSLDEMAAGPVAVRKSLEKSGKCHALIVEDNANERHLMVGFLEMCGYTVDAVEDGYAALGYLADNHHPDIILMDVNMPGLDGPSTVSAIRSNPSYRDIKVFMVSGEDRDSVSVTEGNDGIQQWFSKPIEPAQFADDLARSVAAS